MAYRPRNAKYKDIMVDLETLSTASHAAIVSIGAVKFNKDVMGAVNTDDVFYAVVNVETALDLGCHVSGGTLSWWMGQSDQARAVFADKRQQPLQKVLADFAAWFDHDGYNVWGNGSDFDNVILSNAYQMANIPRPWGAFNNRCFRTLREQVGRDTIKLVRHGTHHNALDDAISQAVHLQKIIAYLHGEYTDGK